MALRFQSPGGGESLLQTLTDTSIGARGGGAFFAWATAYGAAALLESPDFEAFLEKKPFRLIVGTDSITDLKAITKLKALSDAHPLLQVEALVHSERALFHPKIVWFESDDFFSVIVGSGNLTKGGLIGNWEALSVSQHPLNELADLQAALDEWIDGASPGLLPLDDPRVVARVLLNSGDERSVKGPAKPPASVNLVGADYSQFLIAELNKSRKNSAGVSLFSQASFDRATFTKFFNYSGHEVDIVLFPVASDGGVGVLESRKGRYKSESVNYYFELGSVQGVPYPESGRPIAVFGRLLDGGYNYRVVLPGQPGHVELQRWLVANVPVTNPTRMRRAVVVSEVLATVWPGNPLLKAEAPGS
ncbi:MAG: hypothetical protein JWP85_2302 [Rhodoglobus sp.]|nr:hypothetical protein [Rhodoglobus sp.]